MTPLKILQEERQEQANSKSSCKMMKLNKKKCKPIRPFKITPNTIVALRYNVFNTSPNTVSPLSKHYSEAWLDPIPGRDTNFNLIGKYIKCIFPKTYHPDLAHCDTRVLEGEIVALLNNDTAAAAAADDDDDSGHSSIGVKLLIDKNAMETFPFLKNQINDDIMMTTTPDNNNKNQIHKSSTAAKNKMIEEQIRGTNKIIIEITLAQIITSTTKVASSLLPKWVIRKWVPTKLRQQINQLECYKKGKSSSSSRNSRNSRNKGNTIQDEKENEEEWIEKEKESCFRWLASTMHYSFDTITKDQTGEGHTHTTPDYFYHDYYQVGEVINIKRQFDNNNNKKKALSTLAMVTVKRLILPEVTKQGRLAHHGKREIFELCTSNHDSMMDRTTDIITGTGTTTIASTFQVPIEHLIVLGQKLHHFDDHPKKYGYYDGVDDKHQYQPHENVISTDDFFVQYQYNMEKDIYVPITKSLTARSNIAPDDDTLTSNKWYKTCCCSCKRHMDKRKLRLCSTCSSTWWCDDCCHSFRIQYPKEHFTNWISPCCLGIDSRVRSSHHSENLLKYNEISLMRSKLLQLVETKPKNEGELKSVCTICQRSTAGFDSEMETCKKCIEWESCISRKKRRVEETVVLNEYDDASHQNASFLSLTEKLLDPAQPADFDLPFEFLETQWIFSDTKPSSNEKTPLKRKRKKAIKSVQRKTSPSPKIEIEAPTVMSTTVVNADENDCGQFQPTSARCVPCDIAMKKNFRRSNNSAAHAVKSLASIANRVGGREINRPIGKDTFDEKNSSSRAARASQRRQNKEISRLGLNQATDMTGREDVLRFGKSTIHGWGVFCDSFINSGDLIVEYRGILIGNTVADKREKEYEMAKIGSDYMFRIDSETVCDATRHGNVARFINASCTPNCHTQIITVNGFKRIAIYAKRDIWPGEELSYDYKFQPEYDESKRIPCNCGTVHCRGFMNWNKKYITKECERS